MVFIGGHLRAKGPQTCVIFGQSRPLLRLSGLAAAASAGAIAMSAGESRRATTTGGPVGSPATTPRPVQRADERNAGAFSCDLSGYGGSASADGTATFTMPAKATAGGSTTTTFKTPGLPLSAAEAQKLASADTFTLTAPALTAKDSSGAGPKITVYPGVGSTVHQPGPDPAHDVQRHDGVPARRPGSHQRQTPASRSPRWRATGDDGHPVRHARRAPDLSADRHGSGIDDPAGSPADRPADGPAPRGFVGPVYRSPSASPASRNKQTFPLTAPLPDDAHVERIAEDGPHGPVTLSSGPQGLGAPYPLPNTVALTFSGALAVKGAQSGAIPLHRTTAQRRAGHVHGVRAAFPDQPGDRPDLPASSVRLHRGRAVLPGYPHADRLQSRVHLGEFGGRSAAERHRPARGRGRGKPGRRHRGHRAVPGGCARHGRQPARPGSDLPMVLGGVALLLLGGGGAVYAARRRRPWARPQPDPAPRTSGRDARLPRAWRPLHGPGRGMAGDR